jgi:hypothetical protein
MSIAANQIVLATSQQNPSAAWGLDRLATYLRQISLQSDQLEIQATKLGSVILRLHHDRGMVLVLAKNEIFKGKKKAWSKWRRVNGFTGTTWDQDVRLYEESIWEEIAEMSLTEARIFLGIVKPKIKVVKTSSPKPSPEPEIDIEDIEDHEDKTDARRRDRDLSEPQEEEVQDKGLEDYSTAAETLGLIVSSLEELEREGVSSDDLPLIEAAMTILVRLRDAAGKVVSL